MNTLLGKVVARASQPASQPHRSSKGVLSTSIPKFVALTEETTGRSVTALRTKNDDRMVAEVMTDEGFNDQGKKPFLEYKNPNIAYIEAATVI